MWQTFEVICDAPPYCVVKVCNLIGIRNPEDVRWRRMCHHLAEDLDLDKLAHRNPRSLRRLSKRPQETHCTCGQLLPAMDMYTFTFSTGEEATYVLGQCIRCRTVFWEDA